MINKVDIKTKELSINSTEGSFNVLFKKEVKSVEILDNKILVLLYSSPTYGNRNVFCLNERGDILWQVQDPDELLRKDVSTNDSAFMKLSVDYNDIKVFSWNSYVYDVDLNTGSLSNPEFVK